MCIRDSVGSGDGRTHDGSEGRDLGNAVAVYASAWNYLNGLLPPSYHCQSITGYNNAGNAVEAFLGAMWLIRHCKDMSREDFGARVMAGWGLDMFEQDWGGAYDWFTQASLEQLVTWRPTVENLCLTVEYLLFSSIKSNMARGRWGRPE